MRKHYIVRLSDEERQALTALVSTGKAAAYRIKCLSKNKWNKLW